MKRECCDAFLAGQVIVGSLAPGTEHFSKRLIFAFETQERAGLPGGAGSSQLCGHQGAEKEPGTP